MGHVDVMGTEFKNEGVNVRCTCGKLVPAVRVISFPDGVERIYELWREMQKVTTRLPRETDKEALFDILKQFGKEIVFYSNLYAPHVEKKRPWPWYKRLLGGRS